VATIDMRPDNEAKGLWWLVWVERDEIVARIEHDPEGLCHIAPEGPFWSPLKSFGEAYDSPSVALDQVRLYFERRE
jgi:hypothetical protein